MAKQSRFLAHPSPLLSWQRRATATETTVAASLSSLSANPGRFVALKTGHNLCTSAIPFNQGALWVAKTLLRDEQNKREVA